MDGLHLQAIRTRSEDIRRSIEQLIQTLQYTPDRLQWSDALDKFAVLNIQLQHLSDHLKPVLRHYSVRPVSVNQSNASIIPVLLATKLLPEQEAEEATLLEEADDDDAVEAAERLARTKAKIENFNKVIDTIASENFGVTTKRPSSGSGYSKEAAQSEVPPGHTVDGGEFLVAAVAYGAGLS